jgi:hypothetical protein
MKYDDILKAWTDYSSKYQNNNKRGEEAIAFVYENEQWDGGTKASRTSANKETLVFNAVRKYCEQVKNQNRQIEFAINVYQCDEDNTSRFKAFDKLIKHWYYEQHVQEKIDTAFDKLIDYGYAVAEVNYYYEDKYTLNKKPFVYVYDNPSEAFFDTSCQLKSRIDGNYCGRRRSLTKYELIEKYGNVLGADAIKDHDNIVIDFWEREQSNAYYVKLKTGVFLSPRFIN